MLPIILPHYLPILFVEFILIFFTCLWLFILKNGLCIFVSFVIGPRDPPCRVPLSMLQVEFVVQMGDLIDGHCQRLGHHHEALHRTVTELNRTKKPVYHVLGNHELYNFSRCDIMKGPLNSALMPTVSTKDPETTMYYHFSPVAGFRIVVLDSYDISMLGYQPDNPVYQQAEKIVTTYNKNEDLNGPNGLEGTAKYYI